MEIFADVANTKTGKALLYPKNRIQLK